MQLHGKQILYSPSDLANFVACEHLAQLDVAVALGESTRPYQSNAYLDLIARKGEEDEKNFLEACFSARFPQLALVQGPLIGSLLVGLRELVGAGSRLQGRVVALQHAY